MYHLKFKKKKKKNTIRNKHCKTEASPALTNELVCLIYDPQLDIVCVFFFFFFYLVQSLSDALLSLQMVYPRRNLSADQWRNAQLLSLISAPSTMLNPAQSDTVSMAAFFFFFWPGFLNILIY